MSDLNAMRKQRRALNATIADLAQKVKDADAAYRKLRKESTAASVALSKLNREIKRLAKEEEEL